MPAIRAAADAHFAALAPSTADERQRTLRGLRSATILQQEDAAEAEATLKMLRVHVADVPLDILEAACRAYCNAPGKRFFPKSAGELRTFINPLIYARQARAYRLKKLAAQAEKEEAERRRLEDDPLTPEAMAAIKAEFGLDRLGEESAAPAAGSAPLDKGVTTFGDAASSAIDSIAAE
ncbi:hypothetical protein CLG96_02040 [Sphingomonas oleivorans]|uniref:Uncharacterized protein n=1 Tax=Sphingomonas oleivorans TaxID=1735121 RepID=A0A2T5G1C3_9SPHN|nr:hypothetical protein CLG96_02040 [Sphingomonas oleivorans]